MNLLERTHEGLGSPFLVGSEAACLAPDSLREGEVFPVSAAQSQSHVGRHDRLRCKGVSLSGCVALPSLLPFGHPSLVGCDYLFGFFLKHA